MGNYRVRLCVWLGMLIALIGLIVLFTLIQRQDPAVDEPTVSGSSELPDEVLPSDASPFYSPISVASRDVQSNSVGVAIDPRGDSPPRLSSVANAIRGQNNPRVAVESIKVGGMSYQPRRELAPPVDFRVRDGSLEDAPPQRDFEAMKDRFVEVPIKPIRMQSSWNSGSVHPDASGAVSDANLDHEAMELRAKGVAMLLRGEAAGAVDILEAALEQATSEHTRLRIQWMLARAYAKNGQIRQSQQIYEKLAAR